MNAQVLRLLWRITLSWLLAASLSAQVNAWAADQLPDEAWEEELRVVGARLDDAIGQRQWGQALALIRGNTGDFLQRFGLHPATAKSLSMAATAFLRMNMRSLSRAYALNAVSTMELAVGRDAPDLVPLLRHLAAVHERLGDYSAAGAAIARARTIVTRSGPESLLHALVLRDSARIRLGGEDAGLPEGAVDLDHALRILRAPGVEAPLETVDVIELAAEYLRRLQAPNREGRPQIEALSNAVAPLMAVVELRRQLAPDDIPSLAVSLGRLATMLRDTGNFPMAERYFIAALETVQALPFWAYSASRETLWLLREAAIMDQRRGRFDMAFRFFPLMLHTEDTIFQNELRESDEDEQLRFAEAENERLHFMLEFGRSAHRRHPRTAAFGLEATLRRKGIVLDVQAYALRSARTSPEGRAQLAELEALKRELIGRGADAPKDMDERHARELLALRLKLAQTAVFTAAKDYEQVIAPVDLAAVAKALPHDGALVEFVRVREFDWV